MWVQAHISNWALKPDLQRANGKATSHFRSSSFVPVVRRSHIRWSGEPKLSSFDRRGRRVDIGQIEAPANQTSRSDLARATEERKTDGSKDRLCGLGSGGHLEAPRPNNWLSDHSLLLLISYRGSDVRPVDVYNMEHIVILHDRCAERRHLQLPLAIARRELAIRILACRSKVLIILRQPV